MFARAGAAACARTRLSRPRGWRPPRGREHAGLVDAGQALRGADAAPTTAPVFCPEAQHSPCHGPGAESSGRGPASRQG